MIVVDDASDEQHRLEDLVGQYSFLRVIRQDPADKWYLNPCIPYNIGFEHAMGDKIVIQNPECAHIGDVLKYVDEHLTDETYISFSTLSLNKEITSKIQTDSYEDMHATVNSVAKTAVAATFNGTLNWYNHQKYRPKAYHFCSAITKNTLTKLGGFDERFAFGYWYDDDEFVTRIHRAGVAIAIPDSSNNPFVAHQWHYSGSSPNPELSPELVNVNRLLFLQMQKERSINPNDKWQFDIPKILHMYWDMSPMSQLQYLTAVSFHHHNPSWKIVIHTPKLKHAGTNTWHTGEQSIQYTGKDYTAALLALDYIETRTVDFEKLGIPNDIPEVFKSDFFRWNLLATEGGCWSDMDILYVRPISDIDTNNTMIIGESPKIDTSLCIRKVFDQNLRFSLDVHIIGFHLASKDNVVFKHICNHMLSKFNPKEYQSIGSRMLMSLFPNPSTLQHLFPMNNICNLPSDVVYPYSDTQIDMIFHSTNTNLMSSRTIGVHWFNCSPITKNFINQYPTIQSMPDCVIKQIAQQHDH